VTNDAWFGNTSAPSQHASHLVLRTIETRMGVARAANSGITEFVDPLGRAYAATSLNEAATLTGVLRTSDVVPSTSGWAIGLGLSSSCSRSAARACCSSVVSVHEARRR